MSGACCTLPPVETKYTPKGTYSDLGGLRTYISGPEDAKKAIIVVYDIFGFSPQIVQGADLLASQGFRVVMPDFLLGNYAKGQWFAPNASEADTKAKTDFFSGFPGAVSSQTGAFSKVVEAVKASGPSSVGAVGMCWGWKVIATAEKPGELAAVAGAHPSFAAPEDAENISGPICLLPSKDEDMTVMNAIYEAAEKKTSGKNIIKQFTDQPHGWTGARGDVESEDGKAKFSEAYTILAKFFKENL